MGRTAPFSHPSVLLLAVSTRGSSELRHGRQLHACRLGPGSQISVPHGQERLDYADCDQAGEVHRACASQGVSTGQVTGVGGVSVSSTVLVAAQKSSHITSARFCSAGSRR